MKTLYPVTLTEVERKFVQDILTDKETAKTFKQRAQIILLLDQSVGKPLTQAQISKRVGISLPTIFHTIKAFHEEGLHAVLRFKTPALPNKKPVVDGRIEAFIVATACGAPPEGFGRWTVRSLTNKIQLDIAPGISRETVRNTLKKLNLSLT